MEPIQMENWKPKADDPRYVEFDSLRSAEEVFEELRQRLEGIGMLPDEYFDLNMQWWRGKEIPRGADVFCTTDYGESEGIYVDVYLKWYDEQEKQIVTKSFITGKTLGRTGADLDRMFLVASAITKAIHGERGQYVRYKQLGQEEPTESMLISLSPMERKLFVEALVDRRKKLIGEMDGTEQLLRRMVGSITDFIDKAGGRPLHMSDFDKAALAVRDGEMEAFKELYPKAIDRVGELLIDAAGHAGTTGRKMTDLLLANVKQFDYVFYLAANKKAAEIGDVTRVKYMMENAMDRAEGATASYYGRVIEYAQLHNPRVAEELIRWCPASWIAAASPNLMVNAIRNRNYRSIRDLVNKGLNTAAAQEHIFQTAYTSGDRDMADFLVSVNMKINMEGYGVLNTCITYDDSKTAIKLLDMGMDFDGFLEWANNHYVDRKSEAFAAVREHWNASHPQEKNDPAVGHKTLAGATPSQKKSKHRREER